MRLRKAQLTQLGASQEAANKFLTTLKQQLGASAGKIAAGA